MYRCHICGEPLDYPGRCGGCGERPVYDWMDDPLLKEETDVNRKEEDDEAEVEGEV